MVIAQNSDFYQSQNEVIVLPLFFRGFLASISFPFPLS